MDTSQSLSNAPPTTCTAGPRQRPHDAAPQPCAGGSVTKRVLDHERPAGGRGCLIDTLTPGSTWHGLVLYGPVL